MIEYDERRKSIYLELLKFDERYDYNPMCMKPRALIHRLRNSTKNVQMLRDIKGLETIFKKLGAWQNKENSP